MQLPEPDAVTEDSNGRVSLQYNQLVARNRNTFVFLDKVFEYRDGNRDTPLRGATTTSMCPVTEEMMERRMEELRDYEYSQLAHIYDETDTPKGWDEWIEEQINYDGRRIVYDPSYEGKYGPKVEDLASKELGMHDVVAVECIGGGRAFSDAERDYDAVYNEELLEMMQLAESDDPGGFWDQVRELTEE